MASGGFRSDLYYRLNVVRLIVPPLRDRGTDVLLLLDEFLRRFARSHHARVPALTDEARAVLLDYPWPGNVRELKNVAEQIVVKFPDQAVDRQDLLAHLQRAEGLGLRAEGSEGLRAEGLGRRAEREGPGAVTLSGSQSAERTITWAAERAWDQMLRDGKTFWAAVYDVFMDRELTKTDVRHVVTRGLQQTHGSYRQLMDLFHMKPREYRRFLAFLHHHDCHIPVGPIRRESDELAEV
jgi:DNA-binding NtrC family response regulator